MWQSVMACKSSNRFIIRYPNPSTHDIGCNSSPLVLARWLTLSAPPRTASDRGRVFKRGEPSCTWNCNESHGNTHTQDLQELMLGSDVASAHTCFVGNTRCHIQCSRLTLQCCSGYVFSPHLMLAMVKGAEQTRFSDESSTS